MNARLLYESTQTTQARPYTKQQQDLAGRLCDWFACMRVVHCVCSLEVLPQLDPSRSVVMFPSDDAVLPDQVAMDTLDHVIIIDSKW